MPLISRSDCEVDVHDGTFFIVDVSFSWDPFEPSDDGGLSLSAEDDLVGLTLEVWDDEPGDQREAWADVVTRVLRSETGEVCAAELYTGVQDGFLLLGEPERLWNVRVYTRADDEADPREQFLVQFWPHRGPSSAST
ncbi:hypothetical protein [Microbispora sp. KK1-11]|uniref:hypothetical protein n=1 Tax=Microbispora sp. KK1-11 TaxID=2053005 RepID=UPI001156EE52|nr:hypothetical protein [Microbispora sp. KK1-11]TQS21836.1 hypothetical protein FLW16_39020 [Microbispora sp. KK1-11]